MKAQYVLRENPDPDNNDSKKPATYHPRLVSSGTIKREDLFAQVADGTTFSAAELEGAINALTEQAARYISRGYTVELGKLGFLSGALKSTRTITETKNVRSDTIVMHNVNLRASDWFRSRACGPVEQASNGYGKSIDIGFDERLKRLNRHLDRHNFITRREYSQLTGLLKNKALEELKKLVNDGMLIRSGEHSHMIFRRVHQQSRSSLS